jgi:hypothetical protein
LEQLQDVWVRMFFKNIEDAHFAIRRLIVDMPVVCCSAFRINKLLRKLSN